MALFLPSSISYSAPPIQNRILASGSPDQDRLQSRRLSSVPPRCQAAIGYQQSTRSTVMRRQSQCHPASVAWQPVNCGPLGGHHGRSAAGIKEPNREATATGLKPYRARPRYLWHRQMPTPGDLQPLPATQRTRLLTVSPSIAADQSPLDWLCNLCQGGRDGPKGHNRDDG